MTLEDLQRNKTGNAIVGQKTGSPYQVDTIADLRAIDVALCFNGVSVIVLGYYESGDGAGGVFHYDESGVSTDNGGTVIRPTSGGGCWRLAVSNKTVTVLQFGAVTSTSVPSSAVQTANVAAMLAAIATGLNVVWPPGNYFINGTIVLGSASLYDFSNFSAILTYAGSGTAVSSNNLEANITGLYVYRATPDYTDSSIGVLITAMRHVNPSVLVDGFTTGIKVLSTDDSHFFTLNKCYFRTTRCKIGMLLQVLGTGTNSYITANSFRDFRSGIVSTMAGSIGLKIDSSSGDGSILDNTFYDLDAEQVETGVWLECNANSAYGYDFFSCYMEGNTTNFRFPVTGYCYATIFAPNLFNSSVTTSSYGNVNNSINEIYRGSYIGESVQLGRGGTGASNPGVISDGGSGTNGGPLHTFKKNGVVVGYVGTDSAVNGGTGNGLALYSTENIRLSANSTAGLPEYADNAAALSAGLTAGNIYRTVDAVKVVH